MPGQVERETSDGPQECTDPASPTNSDRAGGEIRPSLVGEETGGHVPSEDLLIALNADLRKLAAGKMAREHAVQTLLPTALVHEAWLKLGGQKFEKQAHFFGAAAEAMQASIEEQVGTR